VTSSPVVSGFLSAINGIETIRAYNLEEKFLQMQIERIDQNKRLRITRESLESWFCQRLSLITFFINMTAIGYCMFSENENPSLAGLLLTYALTLADDIIDTIFSVTYLETKMVSVERISTFMKIEPEEGYKEYTKNWRTKEEGFKQIIKNGDINFTDSKVKYRPELPLVLKGISIHIEKG
jgi:ATP-binding cassette subfamily C (CFTR/MRP) protein 2